MKPESKLMCAIFGLSASTDDDFYEELDGLTLHDALMEVLNDLKPYPRQNLHRDKQILLKRFGLDSPDGEGKTLQQIGNEYGISREAVRQIIFKMLRRLRHPRRRAMLKRFIKKVEGTDKIKSCK